MGSDYAMSRVRDALEKSDGNHLKAQRLLMQWLEKDQSLLVGLVAPHLQSIVTHALAHIDAPKKAPAGKKISVKDAETSEFGGALLESLRGGGDTGNFGEATPRHINKPGKTSKAHVDAINKMVSASKNKGGKGKK